MHLCNVFAIFLHKYIVAMIKSDRQQAILNLIEARNIATQENLTKMLAKSGYEVTQSSVSRDLDELGIIKAGGFYALPRNDDALFGLNKLENAGDNLIVARCESGLASAVAVRIDRAKIGEIIGTIAGDDTIFVAVKDKKSQKTAMKKIWEIFEK